MTKVCHICKIEKLPTQFYKAKNGCKRGLGSYCKPCAKKKAKEWVLENPDRSRENLARWQRENRSRARELGRRWKTRNPITKDEMNRLQRNWRTNNSNKARANQILQGMVSAGKIKKPKNCEDCNKNVPRNILHGHHEDYSKPLEVNWLCPPCHGDKHRIAHQREAGA